MSDATRASQEAYRTTTDTLKSSKDRLVEDASAAARLRLQLDLRVEFRVA